MAKYRRKRKQAERRWKQAVEAAHKAYVAKVAKTQEDRLSIADAARADGDIATAAAIYLRLSAIRPVTKTVAAARQRFVELREEGAQQLAAIDAQLIQARAGSASAAASQTEAQTQAQTEAQTEAGDEAGVGTPEAYAGGSSEAIEAAFEKYRELEYQFGRVPGVGAKIKKHVERQKERPEYARVLNEPEASGLLQLAREMEADGQLCCAYYVYEQAKEIPHAASAEFAASRYEALSRDPEVVASAEACAELQWCQIAFEKARQSNSTSSARAIFRQIVKRAPADSDVYRQARIRLGN